MRCVTGMCEITGITSYKSINFFFKSPIGFVFIYVLECTEINVYTWFGGPRCFRAIFVIFE